MATQFQVGKTYACRSFCDYDTVFSFTVTARHGSMLEIEYLGKKMRRRAKVVNGVEQTLPLGNYSMSPILTADKAVA